VPKIYRRIDGALEVTHGEGNMSILSNLSSNHFKLGVFAAGALLIAAQPVSAQTCIQDKFGKSLVCTANDVRIAGAGNIRDISGSPLTKCISGQTFSFIADFTVVTGATSRYDIGLWFATDGDPNHDGARSGVCSANIITPPHTDPAAPQLVTLGSADYLKIDSDACGDISTAHNNQVIAVRVDNVACVDTDGDGKLNLPNCTSWSQNGSVACNTSDNTVPGSPSKCSCDSTFNLPIFVETGSISVTKDSSPASRPEPGGEFTFGVGVINLAQFTTITVDRICDDQFGEIAKVAAALACPTGTLGSKTGTTCSVPTTVNAGSNYSCTFTANVTSNTPTTVTDVVTVSGRDQNNVAVSGSDSAQAEITNVAPSATVVKSLIGLECSDVNYRIRVNNTDTAESLTLSALSDSGFGSITSVHNSVLATTCSVPQTIAASGNYECTFRAHFCGGSHTNTVTATLNDDDGSTAITPQSNSLTVNVNAGP